MDFKITIEGVAGAFTFEKADTVINNIFLSLSIPVGSFFLLPKFGSRLDLLKKGKLTPGVIASVPGLVKEALQWMLDLGRLKSVETLTAPDQNRLNVRIVCTDVGGRKIEFKTFFEVR